MTARVIHLSLAIVASLLGLVGTATAGDFRAGAAAADVTPVKWPVVVNGGFLRSEANAAADPLHARCLVLDDGNTAIALCVVDTCVIPHELVDDARAKITAATGIPADHIMISATHTHSAPSLMAVLGTEADPNYPAYLTEKLVEAVTKAKANLAPARYGFAVVEDFDHTHCRQWVFRPDRMLTDPFGQQNVRVNMHPGYQNASTIGPSGPVDPDLSILSLQTADGQPLAVMANYSMHYFGADAVSADYFGRFCDGLQKAIAPEPANGKPPFVAIMSQGTAGDMHWMDYGQPKTKLTIDEYAAALVKKAQEAYQTIEYRTDATLAMKERDLHLRVREPDDKRLAWAKDVVEKMGQRPPKTIPEVYAREAIELHKSPTRDVKVAAVRIGDVGITTISCEVFALTGLKLKAQSPLPHTFNIELANGEDGYIPPAELHPLGGYTAWPARSACLEVGAEERITEAAVALLEEVSGKPRAAIVEVDGVYAKAITAAQPRVYWRMGQMTASPWINGASGVSATLEAGVLCYLDGPRGDSFTPGAVNRALHFAGGRMAADIKTLGPSYSIDLWFWNGLPGEARAIAGYLFSRGTDGDPTAAGDHLGIGGTFAAKDQLFFYNGNASKTLLAGSTAIKPKTWNHVVLVRDGRRVNVYLNGNATPEITGEADVTVPLGVTQVFLGGRNDRMFGLEGKLDEVAIFDRGLTAEEAVARYPLTGFPVAKKPEPPSKPRSPEESLRTLKVKDGFEVQLVAVEPLTMSPVAVEWGPDGKLWVAEMADYPLGVDDHGKAGGRIRYLEDTDGDGKYDKSTLFMEGVNFPNSIMPWRDGVIVTAAPEIFFAADRDGDGKADVRESLFVGFNEGNTQLRVNGLKWGLDNWVYLANGWSSRDPVRSVKTLEATQVGGRDMHMRPDEGLIETVSVMSEYGRNRDDWGNWFGCDNSHPIYHFVLSERYTRRNPHVAPPDTVVQMTEPNPKVFPLSRGQRRYHSFDQAGHFTSACATMVYRDELLFPREGSRQHFVCEPMHNVVQHRVSRERGTTFTSADRASGEESSDFLASDDEWFRPVNLNTGPDGALYIVDMYRYMIEHPDWLPQEGKDDFRPFYRTGNDRGRIWRIVPTGQHARPIPRLDKLAGPELAAKLDSPNGWQRDMVQQLIVWRKDTAAVAKLAELLTTSKNPLARLHALCTLDGLGAITPELLVRAMSDKNAGVRMNAIRVAEPLGNTNPAVVEAAAKLVEDPDAKVRLQLACSLGEWPTPLAATTLGKLAAFNADDPYISAAVMSSALPHYAAIPQWLLAQAHTIRGPMYRDLLAMALAVGDREVMAKLLAPVVEPVPGAGHDGDQLIAWGAWIELLASRGQSIEHIAKADDALAKHMAQAGGLADAAREAAIDEKRAPEERSAAVSLLGRDPKQLDLDLSILGGLFTPKTPPPVQRAAVQGIARCAGDTTPRMLASNWSGMSPEIHVASIDLLIGHETWAFELMKQVEAGKISPGEIDVPRRQRLEKLGSARVSQLAKKLLGEMSNAAREKVVEAYKPALELTGDVQRGQKVYTQNCAVCHRLGEQGNEIGPDLRSVRDWPADSILANVLDPNRKVEPRYLSFTATLNNGQVVFGVISSETGSSLTIRGLDGKDTTLLRADVKSLEGTNKSLMPDGLEAAVNQQQMADLIRFLKEPPATAH